MSCPKQTLSICMTLFVLSGCAQEQPLDTSQAQTLTPAAAKPIISAALESEGNRSVTQDTDSLLYQLDLETIDGEPLRFETFRGRAVLIVNTASRCGYTGQYAELQDLWTTYKSQGLVVLGVPSNDFGGQEPSSEEKVKSFCEVRYGVDFPLTSKTAVVGTGRHPLYAGLEDALGDAARPKWNFHKVLVGTDGTPIKAFPSNVTPSDPILVKAIEAALPG